MTSPPARRAVRVAVVGLGPWGRNLVRAFARTPAADLVAVCDADPRRLASLGTAVDATRLESLDAVLADRRVDAVAIATGGATQAALALRALEASKHVFVEKPMALAASDALELVRCAEAAGLKLMVGHVLEHHPGVTALESLLRTGHLGDIQRVVSFRYGPSSARAEGSWWSLAPHDVSLARRFFAEEPLQVVARPLGKTSEGFAATLHFPSGTAEIEVASGSPRKIRRTIVLGTRGAAELDDCRPEGPLRLIDVEAALASHDHVAELPGRTVPIDPAEPLLCETVAFVRGIVEDRPFYGDGQSGYRVTAALEAGAHSLRIGRAMRVPAAGTTASARTSPAL